MKPPTRWSRTSRPTPCGLCQHLQRRAGVVRRQRLAGFLLLLLHRREGPAHRPGRRRTLQGRHQGGRGQGNRLSGRQCLPGGHADESPLVGQQLGPGTVCLSLPALVVSDQGAEVHRCGQPVDGLRPGPEPDRQVLHDRHRVQPGPQSPRPRIGVHQEAGLGAAPGNSGLRSRRNGQWRFGSRRHRLARERRYIDNLGSIQWSEFTIYQSLCFPSAVYPVLAPGRQV